ncbi:MAG: hypothetical protein DDT20_00843 [Firmicutes bacterium]|nr:hypothetical protein [Bacillota bacterium]
METEQHSGLTIKLHHDQDCENPLENDPGLIVTYPKNACSRYGNTPTTPEEHADLLARIDAGELIGLPVYVYSHGGVIIKACESNPFSCPWDSGLSGVVYVTRKMALEWQGGKRLTKAKRERTLTSLRAAVDELSAWCNGECYGYIIEGVDGAHLSSCWGFIGRKYALEEARSAAVWHAKEIEREGVA